ncbi:MAG: GntR family transcriptional regulator [Sphaerochaeta sp.]|nr:GntR family transcriptional regulator [Sphaerochaeta sp.]MCI2076941.1 GntR family transcriptional regulator [Sphaerochaeta sp.]MCI2096269.1 GntR family transcriptional regulator [Sphaerochaeta sp.]
MATKMERMTASEQIFRTLRGKILSTVLQPGQMLNVQTLADELGVSRSPVRDALLKLREERLVEILPQSGTRVAPIDMEQVQVERFLRTSLETNAAVRFCRKRTERDLSDMALAIDGQRNAWQREDMQMFLSYDDAFHAVVFQSQGLGRLWDLIQDQSGNYHRIRLLSFSVPDVCPSIMEKHQVMIQAFRDRDEAAVTELEKTHLGRLDAEAGEIERQHPGYFRNHT